MDDFTILTVIQIDLNPTTKILLGMDLKNNLILVSELEESYETFVEKLSQDWTLEEETDSNQKQLF